ncbi:hypothetical protein F4780DRAFT_786120 [Xylariomycetidae sp. FL0641]|nr:hypothetical protein F4780DRAFT_786120 [Xylariomycetidae sp. FL0641]
MTGPQNIAAILGVSACFWLTTSGFSISTPDIRCDIFGGVNLDCPSNTIEGLQGHPASEVLFDIIKQSVKGNDTFYKNDEHVACLYAGHEFVLGGIGIGGDLSPISFNLTPQDPGTLCAFVSKVPLPAGGLTLGEIRQLGRMLIEKCDQCGVIQVGALTGNNSEVGQLQFNWEDPAICQDNCIDIAKEQAAANATKANATNTTNADDPDSAAMRSVRILGMDSGNGIPSSIIWISLASLGMGLIL